MFDLKPFSIRLDSPEKDYLKLLDALGDAQIVCIGDSSHGTEDYYVRDCDLLVRSIESLYPNFL